MAGHRGDAPGSEAIQVDVRGVRRNRLTRRNAAGDGPRRTGVRGGQPPRLTQDGSAPTPFTPAPRRAADPTRTRA